MIVQCDVDCVLNNLMDIAIEIFNNKYNKYYTIHDITTYRLSDCLDIDDAILMKNIFEDPNIWKKVRPVNGAQSFLQHLISDGHDVYLVTDNSPYTYGNKFDWIQTYFPFIDKSKIVCMSDKWMFKSDVMIEDCLENLLAKPYYSRILINKSWNQFKKDDIYGIYRCYNFDDVLAAINKINDGE